MLAPLNVVIVGCKFDQFEKYETENRRWLSKAIRYLAHINNASLAFCSSSKNSPVGAQLRAFMHEVMFEEKPKIVSQRDHLKAIYVYRNQDTLNHIAVPSSGSLSGLEVLRRQLSSLFGTDE
jgi:dynein light intermediate chain 2